MGKLMKIIWAFVVIIWIFNIFIFPNYIIAHTTGSSMEPHLSEGSIVLMTKLDVENLKVGDVIAYEHDDELIGHRIVRIYNDEFLWYARVRGDNNPANDPGVVLRGQIRWKEVMVLRRGE